MTYWLRQDRQHLLDVVRTRVDPTPPTAVRAHRLERPDPLPWSLRSVIGDAVRDSVIGHYPDIAALEREYAANLGVDPSCLVLGAGIDSLMADLSSLVCDPHRAMAYTWPTCYMWRIWADVAAAPRVEFGIDPVMLPDAEGWLGQLMYATSEVLARKHLLHLGMVILSNPGQPAETCYSGTEIAAIRDWCQTRGALLVVDEAYHGFGAESIVSWAARTPGVVALRTLSKVGGAALRVAAAVGTPETLAPLRAVRRAHEVSGPSMVAAMVLLERWGEVQDAVAQVVAGRDWLAQRLREGGYSVIYHRCTNYLLIDMGSAERASQVGGDMWGRGVRVRHSMASPCDRYLMISCGLIDTMREVVVSLEQASVRVEQAA